MKTKLPLMAFLCILFAYSCKKSNEEPQQSATTTTTTITTPPVITPPAPFGFYVVSYFPSYRDVSAVSDARFRMCNVVCYAFATVSSTGGLTVNSPSVLSALVVKAKANGTKVMISLNGDVADWKSMAATASGRTGYIKKVMSTVRTYGLQGVDVDWEFPSTADGTDVTYTALMKELSDSCHTNAKYYLSATLTSGKYIGSYTNAIKDELLKGTYVDFFSIMAYDDFNTTFPYRQHSTYALAQTCLNYWVTTRGLPSAKAVLGMPAYGRPSGITQTGTILSYSGILGQGGSALSDSAVVTAAGFNNYKIYYNGTPTIKKKTILAKSMANGVMMWEMGQDTNDANCLLKAACDTIGRTY